MQIRDAVQQADERAALGGGRVPDRAAGVTEPWTAVGPPHKRRHLLAAPVHSPAPPACTSSSTPAQNGATSSSDVCETAACLLQQCECGLLRSSAFAKWLRQVTDLSVTAIRSELRRFRPGLDYTVATGALLLHPESVLLRIYMAAASSYKRIAVRAANLIYERMCQLCTRAHMCHESAKSIRGCLCAGDPQMQREAAHSGAVPPRLDATLCFADDSDETAAAAWASDDVGGFQCYIVADDEADAAAETYTCVSAASCDAVHC